MDQEDWDFLELGENLIKCPRCNYSLLNPIMYSEASNLSEFTKKLSTHELLFHSGEDINLLCKCYMCDYIWVIDRLTSDEPFDEEEII